MDSFINRQNVTHFRELLARETDAAKRKVLERLLAEEEGRADAAVPATPTDGPKP
jgi:hypothetical protein